MRRWAVLAAVAAIGLCGASQAAHGQQQQPQEAKAREGGASGAAQSQKEEDERSADAPANGGQRMTAYERESLVIDRAANSIAERANGIARDQRLYALWQLVLGGFGVGFTGFAAFFAYRATHWAKEAASQSRRSADADNAALSETRNAAAEARKDAEIAATRFDQQMAKTGEMVEFTAKSAYAMDNSANATRKLAIATRRGVELAAENTAKQLRPYVYITGESLAVTTHSIGSFGGGAMKTYFNDDPAVIFSIKNFGQTPAKRVRLRARVFIGEHWTEGGLVDLETAAIIHRADMPPGFERPITGYNLTGLSDAHPHIRSGERSVFFDGLIEYEDAGGRAFKTHFRRVCTGEDLFKGTFFITPEGNEAT